MALVSFTLRSTAIGGGSYARYFDNGTTRTDVNDYLRSDGYTVPPAGAPQSLFSVTESGYGKLDVSWDITTTAGEGATLESVSVVYSQWGEPQTILEGETIAEQPSSTSDGFLTSIGSLQHDVPQGKWAYYSLFVKYEFESSVYYERVASIRVLATEYLGSTYLLWNRIPEYYRELDSESGVYLDPADEGNLYKYGYLTPTNKVGTLFRFLSVFGFEIDRERTLLNYMMVSRDPSSVETQGLQNLAEELGSVFDVSTLGPQTYREILDNLPYIRRRKGTLEGVYDYAKVIGNCGVEIDTDANTIDFYAQRTNYLHTPASPTISAALHRGALASELTSPEVFSYSTDIPTSYTASGTPQTFSGICAVMIRLPQMIPVKQGDVVAFSVQYPNCGQSAVKWIRLVDASDNPIGFSTRTLQSGAYPVFVVNAAENVSTTAFTAAYVDIYVDLTESDFILRNCLLERNYVGQYFDGSTVRGGWLTTSSNSYSDFLWTGATTASISTFVSQRYRTQAALSTVVDEVLPIDEAGSYTISYSQIPGSSVLS